MLSAVSRRVRQRRVARYHGWVVACGVFVAVAVIGGGVVLFVAMYLDALGAMVGRADGGRRLRVLGLSSSGVAALAAAVVAYRLAARRSRDRARSRDDPR
jgi:hypothetical protein